MKRARTAVLAVCAATFLVAGCGSSGDEKTTPAADADATATSTGADSQFPDLKGQQIVFTNYGGATLEAAKKAWLDPFAEKTGLKVTTDSPTDPAKVKAMVQAGRPTWNIVDIDTGTGAFYCGKLFEKRGADVDISAIDQKWVTDDCGVPIMLQAIALIYNTDRYGDKPPTKITDFFNTKEFPGKRSIANLPVGGWEPLAAATGLAPDKVYPIDYARVSKAVKGLGSDLVYQSTLSQQAQQLESGNFDMCICYTGRAALSAEKGAKNLGIVWQHATIGWDALYRVKGSKNQEAQAAMLNYIATPEGQAAFTEVFPYGPTAPDAKPNIPESFGPFLPAGHEDEIGGEVLMDGDWLAKNIDEATAKWTEMTAG